MTSRLRSPRATVGLVWQLAAGPRPTSTFVAAHALAAAADAMVSVSLAGSLFFNLSPEASRSQVLIYLAVTMAPFAVLAPLVGPVIDRFRHGQVVVAALCYVLRAVCCLGLALVLYELSFYALALVLLIINKASGVVKHAMLPRLNPGAVEMITVNSRITKVATVAGGLGLGLGAAVLQAAGAAWLLRLAALTFLLASLVVLRVQVPPAAVVRVEQEELEFAELHTPYLVLTAGGFMVLRGAVGFFAFMLIFSLRRESAPAWFYALSGLAYGAGSMIAILGAPRLRRRLQEEAMMALALAAPASITAIAVLGFSWGAVLATSLVIGMSAMVGRQALDSVMQRTAPDAVRGQTFARYETRFQLAWVVGALLATATALRAEAAMGVLAALFLPAAFLYARSTRQALRFRPPPAGDAAATVVADRLHAAEHWLGRGQPRLAVVEAAAALDVYRAARADAQAAASAGGDGDGDGDEEHDRPAARRGLEGRPGWPVDGPGADIDLLRTRAMDPACGVTMEAALAAVRRVRVLTSGGGRGASRPARRTSTADPGAAVSSAASPPSPSTTGPAPRTPRR